MKPCRELSKVQRKPLKLRLPGRLVLTCLDIVSMMAQLAFATSITAMALPIEGGFLNRRSALIGAACLLPSPALAVKDCYLDCEQNCNRVAPRSGRYCEQTCGDYCLQDDRRDGLSGSVSNEGAEAGLLSAYDLKSKLTGQAPSGVVYGEDRPPALPDLLNVAPILRSAVTGGKRPLPGGGRWSVEGQGGLD